jgi:hypothetical protein
MVSNVTLESKAPLLSTLSNSRHAVIGGKDESCPVVLKYFLRQFSNSLDQSINSLNVAEILHRLRAIGMTSRVEPKQVEEEECSLLLNLSRSRGVLEKPFKLVQHPSVQFDRVCILV